jgi:hypothetical protein
MPQARLLTRPEGVCARPGGACPHLPRINVRVSGLYDVYRLALDEWTDSCSEDESDG